MYTQVTESLSDMFKSEKQVLDTNATIELNADPFPYELVFNWVYNNYNSSVPVSSNCMLWNKIPYTFRKETIES